MHERRDTETDKLTKTYGFLVAVESAFPIDLSSFKEELITLLKGDGAKLADVESLGEIMEYKEED